MTCSKGRSNFHKFVSKIYKIDCLTSMDGLDHPRFHEQRQQAWPF